MNDTERILVKVKGLEKIALRATTHDQPDQPALTAALSQLGTRAYAELWVPRAALVQGALLTLPEGTAVRVIRVLWASTAQGHLATPVATIQIEKEELSL